MKIYLFQMENVVEGILLIFLKINGTLDEN